MCAEKMTYSFRSTGSAPGRMPTVLGAVCREVMTSRTSTAALRESRSWRIGRPDARTAAGFTPATASADAITASRTSTTSGRGTPRSSAVRSRVCATTRPANATESASLSMITALGPAR